MGAEKLSNKIMPVNDFKSIPIIKNTRYYYKVGTLTMKNSLETTICSNKTHKCVFNVLFDKGGY